MTPYLTHLAIRGRGRRAFETATATGWMSERFAREQRLSSLMFYLSPKDELAETDGDALVASFAMMHGLRVETVDEPADQGLGSGA